MFSRNKRKYNEPKENVTYNVRVGDSFLPIEEANKKRVVHLHYNETLPKSIDKTSKSFVILNDQAQASITKEFLLGGSTSYRGRIEKKKEEVKENKKQTCFLVYDATFDSFTIELCTDFVTDLSPGEVVIASNGVDIQGNKEPEVFRTLDGTELPEFSSSSDEDET